MPTKRTYRMRNRTVLHLDSFGLREILCFVAAWRPPATEAERSRSRWQTWTDYLGDYLEVRGEFLASNFGQRHNGELPFAERVYQQHGTSGPSLWTVPDVEGVSDSEQAKALQEYYGRRIV